MKYAYTAMIIACILTISVIMRIIIAENTKEQKFKAQQEVIFKLQNDLLESVENSLNRTNALAARNWQRIKMLEAEFGLQVQK